MWTLSPCDILSAILLAALIMAPKRKENFLEGKFFLDPHFPDTITPKPRNSLPSLSFIPGP